ncbi:MAG TPA: HIT domain-containing protein [Coriobacteriia bacterium]
MENCIFCMVADHSLDARVIYEDDTVIAFDDITPQAPIHTLIVPKEHYGHMGDGVPADVLCALFAAVPGVAAAKGIAESGYRVIVNNGPDAAQSVHHLHLHVLGGARMSHGMLHFE